MMANLLRAIQCIVKNSISDLVDDDRSRNRINQIGVPLEELVKDIFADTLESDKGTRVIKPTFRTSHK
jgi:NgoPII restriction endonuclease